MSSKKPSIFPIRSSVSDAMFLEAWEHITEYVPRSRIDALAEGARRGIAHMAERYTPQAVAWSGGKDSLVIYDLAASLGIHDGVLGLTTGLEYPAFEQWLQDYQPARVEAIRRPLDMSWLVAHPDMLFPRSSRLLSLWYKLDWQQAQDDYCRAHGIRLLLLGRRTQDHNFTGPQGQEWYERGGVVRYSPLKDWLHEEILAYLAYHQIELSPFYFWYNGFTEATHPWPSRAQTIDDEDAWAQLYSIDPAILQTAAPFFPSAQDYLAHPVPQKTHGPKKQWRAR